MRKNLEGEKGLSGITEEIESKQLAKAKLNAECDRMAAKLHEL